MDVCRTARANCAFTCIIRHNWQTDGGGLYPKDINTWSDIVARCLRMAGLTAKDMVQVAYGYGLFTGGLGAHYGAERLGATVIPMSGGQTEKQVQLIQDFKPTAIMVTPSYCVSIIESLSNNLVLHVIRL